MSFRFLRPLPPSGALKRPLEQSLAWAAAPPRPLALARDPHLAGGASFFCGNMVGPGVPVGGMTGAMTGAAVVGAMTGAAVVGAMTGAGVPSVGKGLVVPELVVTYPTREANWKRLRGSWGSADRK